MCGIIGFAGNTETVPILLDGLERLEYRGYDSAGVAVVSTDGRLQIKKCRGRLGVLREALAAREPLTGQVGIGHTRWATHGEPNDVNAHPHVSQNGKLAVVHNGIIENYLEIKQSLLHKGVEFASDTDTEVIVQLLEYYYKKSSNLMDAVYEVLNRIKGAYAMGIICSDFPEQLIAVRKDAPLLIGYGADGNYIASDVTALLAHTRTVTYMEDDEVAVLTADRVQILGRDGCFLEKEKHQIQWDVSAAEKGGYAHFMLKEIHEQPDALKNTILPRLSKGLPDLTDDGIPDFILKDCSRIHVIACGTAMHAGMVARALIEPGIRIPVTVSIASEFRYETPLIDEKTLVIVISQSGETIDTLAAMRLAQSYHAPVLAIVNVKGSTIARESDYVLYTHAGPEIAVASTKAYSVQLAALYLIYCRMALVRGVYSPKQAEDFMKELLDAIPAMEAMISRRDEIKNIVTHIISKNDAFFIGRGLDYAFSLEGALKLKEISYIHAEAYAAGELKHGTIALISEQVPVIAIATQEHIFAKTISNVREVKARGAFVILLVKDSAVIEDDIADVQIRIPDIADSFTVFPIAAILQLIAYYASVGKNLDVDQPRNLAKSVTVE